MNTYYAIYNKVLSTDSERFETYNEALAYYTKRLWKYQVFTLVELRWNNGKRVSTQKKYIVYEGVAELV